MIGLRIILFLQNYLKFSSPLTANFWLHAGNVATFQLIEKNNEAALYCYYFEMLSAFIKISLLDMLRLRV